MTMGALAFTCDQEIDRVRALTGAERIPQPAPFPLDTESLDALAEELDRLTAQSFKPAIASVQRAAQAGNHNFVQCPPAWAIVRLKERLKAGEIGGVEDNHALGYLQLVRQICARWIHHPLFSVIGKSLCNEFNHAMTMLSIASYLADHGNAIGITAPIHEGQSPDLYINTTVNDRLSIEVKAPKALFWPSAAPSKDDIERCIRKELNGARDQLTGSAGGLVVIGCSHPDPAVGQAFTECIREIMEGKRHVSSRIAAVGGVSFTNTLDNGSTDDRPILRHWFDVSVQANPRFEGPNPVNSTSSPHQAPFEGYVRPAHD
ncbi:hypothetical protein [Burkholderia sp. YIM B11467]